MTMIRPSDTPLEIGDLVMAGSLKVPTFGIIVFMNERFVGVHWADGNRVHSLSRSHAENLKFVVDTIRKT